MNNYYENYMNNKKDILIEDPQTKKESSIIELISPYILTGMAVYPLLYVTVTSVLSLFSFNITSSLYKLIIALFFSFITTVWIKIAIKKDKNSYTLLTVNRKIMIVICYCAIIYGLSYCYKKVLAMLK